MKKYFPLGLLALSLSGFGCASQAPAPAQPALDALPSQQQQTPPPLTPDNNQRALNNSLIGSWHAAPSIDDGIHARYAFFTDGSYLYLPSQNGFNPAKQDGAEYGTWTQTGNDLTLQETSALKITIIGDYDISFTKVDRQQQKTLTLGDLQKTDPAIVYPFKRSFGSEEFWKYADDPLYWCPPNDAIHKQNPDRDYKACQLLLNAYAAGK